jgi:tryptophanyl-tRNA synthetase
MKKRVLSGIRPTGKLHWGNYFGALRKWVEVQETHECFFFIADWHALTTGYEHPNAIESAVYDATLDLLSAGIDPEKSTLFLQSLVLQHAELFVLLSMLTPLGWLERVPSYKDMKQQLADRDLNQYGFLGYPLLQAADIVIYNADFVPVGEDQVAHLEFARELLRRFHFITKKEVLVEPQPMLTEAARVPGTDGRKMSKSFDNAILMADDDETIRKKMMTAITDPARMRRDDPGNPEVCNIFAYHSLYTEPARIAAIDGLCRSAGIGCVDCKKECIANAVEFWKPVRDRRKELEGDREVLDTIVRDGSDKARAEAEKTMKLVRDAMGVSYNLLRS